MGQVLHRGATSTPCFLANARRSTSPIPSRNSYSNFERSRSTD
jgi:hypothetical protein